jgi:hypothetical protein
MSHLFPVPQSPLNEASHRRYMLRRTLFPWKPQETIDEAVSYCREYGIDEVVWIIDTEEFSHGLPTLERIRSFLPWLDKARDQLREAGIVSSINPWVTMGMRDAGWDLRRVFPDFDWLTDIDGTQTKSQACPLNPAFREWLATAYELYADTRPRYLWIEDDIRVHNHRPARFTCFCPKHLAAFAERTGRHWTLVELREEILRPGPPSPLRGQWLDFVGDAVAEVLELLQERVYARSKETTLALMCSGPSMHAMERRDWDRVLKAVAGPRPYVAIRPCMGNYSETSPQGLYGSRQRLSGTLACVRQPFHSCTEIENWPFSRFSKSARFTRAQVLLSAALRSQSMTLNIHDHLGTPLMDEPQYGEALRSARPIVDALVEACPPGGREPGFRMLHPEDGPRHKTLRAGATFGDLSMGEENWAMPLQALGLPVTWQESNVVAVSGQKLEGFSPAEIRAFFKGGVLLDLSALETLQHLGLAEELAGVTVEISFIRIERETPAEELTDPAFGGPGRYMTVDHIPLRVRIGQLKPAPEARVISHFVNADRERVLPGIVLTENGVGGRVAVVPYDMSDEVRPWFLNWHRQRQFTALARWLFRDDLPLLVEGGAYPLPIRVDHDGRAVITVFNLSQDDWPGVSCELTFARPVSTISRLAENGNWIALGVDEWHQEENRIKIRTRAAPAPLDAVSFRVG